MQYPNYKSYEEYKGGVDELKEANDTDSLYEIAKMMIMNGKQALQNLEARDPKYRNTHLLQSQKLKDIQTLAVMNSLCISKLKMQKDTQFLLKINYEKSLDGLAALDLMEKPVRK